jgi:serpin B
MKAIIAIALVVFIVLLIIMSGGPSVKVAEPDAVVEANNRFAFDIYSKYKSEKGNVFYSPYSIFSVLAMCHEGARKKTAEEIAGVLNYPEDSEEIRTSYLGLYGYINKAGRKYTLNAANALWAHNEYKFINKYFALIRKYFRGRAENLDFTGKPEESRLTINNWVEEKTNGKIEDLIPKGYIDAMTRLVITNAIYFKGLWLEKFGEEDTKEEDFFIEPGNSVRVPMMRLSGFEAKTFNYAETDTLQILELPYEGEEISMLVILPKENDLSAVEDSLSTGQLSRLKGMLSPVKVEVYLPRFKFETKYFMAKDLKAMGMSTAFSAKADFSGMSASGDLYISEVIHQAYVEVNEEGAEAAAATAGIIAKTALPVSAGNIFRADHPFIFIIQDTDTGCVLFLGRVRKPLD